MLGCFTGFLHDFDSTIECLGYVGCSVIEKLDNPRADRSLLVAVSAAKFSFDSVQQLSDKEEKHPD